MQTNIHSRSQWRPQAGDGSGAVLKFSMRSGWFAGLAVCAMLLTSRAEVSMLTTITNPAPTSGGGFGYSVAVVGSDRVLVGNPYVDDSTNIYDSGEAYLFDIDGTLITTFTNPSPASYENFGYAVGAAGSDRVVVGAPGVNVGAASYAGAVYLFETNGTLIAAATNAASTTYAAFGSAVAVLGNDRIIVGAPKQSIGLVQDGAVYLCGMDGAILNTIANPIPGPFPYDNFGCSVAAIGSSKLIVGANQDEPEGAAENAGVAHIFSSTGALLTTITNPASVYGDFFGWSVAAVGSEKVLIGEYKDDTGAIDAGVAHLFLTNGTLSTTITNPSPTAGDWFGYSVAADGDLLIIGAPNDYANAYGGAVYLYNNEGVYTKNLTNPTPSDPPNHRDRFGWSVAAGSGRLLVGAYEDDEGGTDAGVAHVFDLGSQIAGPWLTIILTNANQVGISWEPNTPGFILQETFNLATNTFWFGSSSGSNNPAVVPTTQPATFYRLYKP